MCSAETALASNPNTKVIEMMFRRRRAASPKPFRFWFNSSEAVSANPTHMAKVETLVKKLAKTAQGTIHLQISDEGQFDEDPVSDGWV